MAKPRANGEENIRKRKGGRWEGRYTAGQDPTTGKAIIKNVLGETQAEVKKKLERAIAESGSLDVQRAGQYTVGQWAHQCRLHTGDVHPQHQSLSGSGGGKNGRLCNLLEQ